PCPLDGLDPAHDPGRVSPGIWLPLGRPGVLRRGRRPGCCRRVRDFARDEASLITASRGSSWPGEREIKDRRVRLPLVELVGFGWSRKSPCHDDPSELRTFPAMTGYIPRSAVDRAASDDLQR